MSSFPVLLSDFDRVDTSSENVGGPYYGKDDGEGHTDWYDSEGNLSASSETPESDDEFQHRLQEWEKHSGNRDY